MNADVMNADFGAVVQVAGSLATLVLLSGLLFYIGFRKTWWGLHFRLRAWLEAHRAMAAGATDPIVEGIERALARACFEKSRVLSLSDAVRAWLYITLSGDTLAGHRHARSGLVLIAVLVAIDGAALGYALAPVAGVNVSEHWLTAVAGGAGIICAVLLALSMHAAGRHLHAYRNTRSTRGRILSDGGMVPANTVLLSQPQDIDQDQLPAARRFARIGHAHSLVPVVFPIAFVLFVAGALWNLRYQELVQLEAAHIADLPTDAAILTGITVLSVLFAALQFSTLWIGFNYAWDGRESEDASRRLLSGALRSEWDVIGHNRRALTFANSIHLRFHEHLLRLNNKEGCRPLRPIVYPAQVLAQMLSERADTETVQVLLNG